jgi:hypothetical protein
VQRFWFLLLLAPFSFTSGCAHYEFDLTRPPDFARHIGDQKQERFTRDPLEYRMQSAEGRLVIEIFNPTNDTIQLIGRQSSVVDPNNQSHPLLDQTIAPSSYAKLILPPMRPQATPTGPSIGVNISSGGSQPDWNNQDWPRNSTAADAGSPLYWDWEGDGDVRLTLVFRRGNDQQFQHEFTFHRKRS